MHLDSLINEPLFPILLGITVVPREIENNGFAKFFFFFFGGEGGVNNVHYSLCENGQF